jgi:hypothetical protein
MNKKQHKALGKEYEMMWENPPAPFNFKFNPNWEEESNKVYKMMEDSGFYATHTRAECAKERARLFKELDKLKGE